MRWRCPGLWSPVRGAAHRGTGRRAAAAENGQRAGPGRGAERGAGGGERAGSRARAGSRRGAMPWMELHRAARDGRVADVERLIAARADVEAKDDFGKTPLHKAAIYGHSEVAGKLLAAGAAVGATDDLSLYEVIPYTLSLFPLRVR
jgi:hypothetical protein